MFGPCSAFCFSNTSPGLDIQSVTEANAGITGKQSVPDYGCLEKGAPVESGPRVPGNSPCAGVEPIPEVREKEVNMIVPPCF